MKALLLAVPLATTTPVCAFQEASHVRPDELLLCLDRKVARGDGIGLWYRDLEGRMTRVWDGEPYDSLWLLDRSVMVVERWKGRVVHLSPEFEELRSIDGFTTPVDVERGRNGLWIVVEHRPGRVVGVDPETGERVWTRTGFDGPFDATPLADGGLLVADSGNDRIVRLDADGRPVRTWTGIDFPNVVEPTSDGGFLVANWTGGEVRRFDAAGLLSWHRRVGGTLQSAEERPDGRITVSDGYGGHVYYLSRRGLIERVDRFPNGCVDCETVFRP